ncbi:vacuolar-sorting protein SNF8-like [Paralichthys olivaceus]|uniref:vacuolar-sorting protein SNF8-like n=1 Tax=Paralichthys olivaceus TaxID=8255 RepID=UPI00374FE3C0
MRRRGVGAEEEARGERGSVLAEDQIVQVSKQLETFKSNLEELASKHKQEIRKNSQSRVQFQEMCAAIGVDPLASEKGFWSEMLGVGDFYYELGVQIIEVCLALKHRNGGLITLDELHQRVLRGRGKYAQDKKGYVTVSEIKAGLKWEKERACRVLDHLLKEGLAWLDSQAAGESQYWLPALFSELTSRDVTPEEANQMTP